ncbi:hypothetical protein AA129_004546 [Salmonella enterica subsp. enterica serovar Lexington]|nr:hypothetical protein [Salmonella enterica subsp. enterica serovar Lexington]
MKQMSLIEMDGFLKGKCIPSDLKVNETNAEYLVRKFGELESKLETALRECRSAGITIDNLEAKCAALAAESSGMKKFCKDAAFDADYEAELGMERGGFSDALNDIETPATDAFLAEVRAQGADELAELYFTLAAHEANRYIADSWRESARFAKDHAAQLRQKAAQ